MEPDELPLRDWRPRSHVRAGNRGRPGRFVTFAHLDWAAALGTADPAAALVRQVGAFPPEPAGYRTAFRFCETDDEAFGYVPGPGPGTGKIPPQGRWHISAAGLPAALLPDFCAGDARRVLHRALDRFR